MNGDALILVLAGAMAHATWNYQAKKAAGGAPFVALYGLVSFALSAPLALYFLSTLPAARDLALLGAALLSAIVHLVYSLTLQRGYQVSDLTVVYPVARGAGPLFSVAGAILLLGERPSLPGWLGIAVIFVGILLIAGGQRLFGHNLSPGAARGLRWGLATGLCIAAYTVIDGWSVKTLHVTPIVFYAFGLSLRSVLIAPFALRKGAALQAQWQRNRARIIAVGLLSPLAYTLVLYAMTRAPLSYVAPIRELSMMIAALLGIRLLREEDARQRLAGSALMAVGVVILALA